MKKSARRSTRIGRHNDQTGRSGRTLRFEALEERSLLSVTPVPFTAGNIAVLQLAATSSNTTGSVLELSPSAANQANPVQPAIPISSMYFSDSGTSGFLSDTSDGSLLAFGAYNTQNQTATITAASWSSGVETITAANNFVANNTVTLAGMNPSTGDGTFTLVSASSTKFTYDVASNPGFTTPYGTATSLPSDLADITASGARGVGTLSASASFTLQTSYTESASGDQTRSATSPDDSTWYITDKGGLFTNNATTNSLVAADNNNSVNILNTRSFGGTVYASSTKFSSGVSTLASATTTTAVGLPGIPADGNIQDFYLLQSGHDGSTYDVLYTLDQGLPTSSTAQINKYYLNGSTWQSEGTYALQNAAGTAISATGMIAENNGNGGANLYVVTTAQAADNSLVEYTDTAAYNATINVNSASAVTLYTATGTSTLKGVAFVPSAATAPTVSTPTQTNIGINSAVLGGTVSSTGSQYVSGYGVVYSLTSVNSNPTIGGSGVTQLTGSGTPVFSPFTVSATGLQGTSAYSYAAYAINSVGTTYSTVGTFTTQSANPPTIDTPTDTTITNSSAVLGGTVEANGGATISKTGVVYALTSANSNPQIGGSGVSEVDTTSPVTSGAFTVSASGLSAGSGYTFEAFATNSSGTSYTAATTFNTLAAPTVNTPTFTAITSSAATLGGNVASNGGATITKTGVVYALTSANSNPQIGGSGVSEVDTSSPVASGAFTVSATGLAASTSYTFEAFASNSIGTSYTAASSFSTAAPGIIAAWTFPAVVGAPDNSPAPTYGTGTATTLGMTNSYNGGNTASDDVLSTSGTANTNFTENLWRVRGTANNGWALAAPEYSQGIELDTSTVGYSNIVFAFDWYSTTQGIRDLQVQYNTGSGWVNYQGPSPTGTFVTGGNDYYNSQLSPVNPTIYVNLSGVAAANNNADLGIRLVSAYDSTGTLGNVYASAASTAGDIIAYNNSSGNWRFGNLIFYGNSTITSTTVTATPPAGQNPGQNVTFTATVTPASGTQYASGTVAFYDGSNQIGTTQTVTQVGSTNVGTASITLNTLTAGVHGDITAQYTPALTSGMIASGSSMNLVAGAPADNPISYTINAPQATGVDVSPVVGQAFTGVVATFSDGTYTNPSGFSAAITWGDGHTSNGVIAFAGSNNETNINGQIVTVSLFTVTGTNTYATAGSYAMSVTVTDPNSNTATVNPTARVAYPPLVVTDVATINSGFGASLSNQTVATFTDPGLVANMTALGISDPTTQFSASINWGDTTVTAGTISYNSTTQVFSVVGSHSYAQANSYSISVSVTPLTVSVERIDSSDPTDLNEVGDENGNTLTDSPSPDFIDQFVTDPGSSSLQSSLYTFSLPTVATTSGNEALTNSSYSLSEGELTLSTNGEYLVTGGYNDTVSLWEPQQTYSPASVINRVIATINGAGVINTTTDLTDTYSGDNFRGVVSTDGTQFWTSGHSSGASNDYVHYATLGATASTMLTGPANTPYDPDNINTVEIFNGQLYEGVRSAGGTGAPAGIYQIGSGLPTTSGQSETLFIALPQSNPLDVTAGDKPMSPFGFYLADLDDGNPTINGVNVAYVADAEMGIARYDYGEINGETSPQWNFSYYINSTGSFLNSTYTVNSDGSVTPTGSFNAANPIPASNPNADPTKAGGVRELTGRVVNGQVQLFAITGFGTGSQPNPGESLIEVTDTGPNAGFTKLATDSGASELTGVAFTPTQTVTTAVQVAPAQVIVNSISPQTGTSGSTFITNSLVFELHGSGAGAHQFLDIYQNGNPIGAALSSSNGTWSFAVGVPQPGTYSLVAVDTSDSTDYTGVAQTIHVVATATVSVTDASGTFNSLPYTATATVTGTGGNPVSSLEGITPTLQYYAGSTATGTGSSTAPVLPGTYTVVGTFAGSADYASAVSSPVTFTIGSPGAIVGTGNFNGGSTPDLLWQNSTTGQVGAWIINSGTITSGALWSVADPKVWKLAGTGDFTGNGTSDILWINTTNGEVGTWLINNAKVTGWSTLSYVNLGTWNFEGIGDFTGNGTADVLWQSNSGQVGAWLISNAAISGWSGMPYADPTQWKIIGLGDFTGDGTTDVLWQNTGSGVVGAWLMNNGVVSGWLGLGGASPTAWKLVGVGDFNNSSTADLLWESQTTPGTYGEWLVQNNSITWVSLPYADPTQWQLVAVANVAGGASQDLVWESLSTGTLGAWEIQDGVVTGWSNLGQG